jgi:hypothetical protein
MGCAGIILPIEVYEQVLRLDSPIRVPSKFCAPARRPSGIHFAYGVDQAAAAAGNPVAKIVIAIFTIAECRAASSVYEPSINGDT